MGNRLRIAGLAVVLLACASFASAQSVVNGTQYTLFWRGDLRIIATRPNTQITIYDASTGLPLSSFYTANITGNPFTLGNAGDSYEANNGTQTYRIRIVADRAGGPREDKPVIVWTGALEAGLKHPAAPPTTTNAWLSILPSLAPGSVENGSEIGREFWGFFTQEAYIFARKGPQATSIVIDDLATNVETDTDDTQTVTPASPSLLYADAEVELYHLTSFEDDTVHVTANTDISIWTGIGSTVGNDWTVSPPSWGAGEDARELGTLFYAFVPRDLTVFPTADNTTVTITDLSDGDDSTVVTLAEGDLFGDYDIFTPDTYARNGTGIAGRAANPAVRLNLLGANAPFDYDIVKVEADKPVLVYVGPKAADTFEYADVAYTIQTGPTSYLMYCYAQNGGAEDFQMFAQNQATNVTITSLTKTLGFGASAHHDWSIPSVTPWLGGNATTSDWYWASGAWSGEMLRIESDGPVSVISGDYDGPNFGCFIPFVADSGLLRPVADAGPDFGICPGGGSITLDGSRSFDADTTPGALPPRWTWDTNPALDSSGDGNTTNDADLVGAIVSFTPSGSGPWIVTLTFTDDDGQVDTDILTISSEDIVPPVLSCPVTASGVADATGMARVDVLATASDDCPAPVTVTNDRTPNGADATDDYPCGYTNVLFTAVDGSGNRTTCTTRVTVTETTPPDLRCPSLVEGPGDATGSAFLNVVATATDLCSIPTVVNTRTANGADASDTYRCGETTVTFTATDLFGNSIQCSTLVRVLDGAAPVISCPARITSLPDSPTGATVGVGATATDECDPNVPIFNDRTPNGPDATDFYPCGETTVTFSTMDAAGHRASCQTVVAVAPPGTPNGLSPWLRVDKRTAMDPHQSARLFWTGAPAPQPWEHYEVRRTTVDETRPYPILYSDPAFTQREYIDTAAAGRLWYYQVHVVDCAGAIAMDPLALSP